MTFPSLESCDLPHTSRIGRSPSPDDDATARIWENFMPKSISMNKGVC